LLLKWQYRTPSRSSASNSRTVVAVDSSLRTVAPEGAVVEAVTAIADL